MPEIPMNERTEMIRHFVEAFGSVDGKAVAPPNIHKTKNGGYKLSVPSWCIHDYAKDETDKLINSIVQRKESSYDIPFLFKASKYG